MRYHLVANLLVLFDKSDGLMKGSLGEVPSSTKSEGLSRKSNRLATVGKSVSFTWSK